MTPLKRLRLIEKESLAEYPMPGEPVEGECLDFDKQRVTRLLPHIRTSTSEGIYLNYWVDSYERAWEISMQKVAELRGFGKVYGSLGNK